MRSIASMRKRAWYLRRQADEFRRVAKLGHDPKITTELLDLADRCNQIAVAIEENIPIHQKN